MHRVGDGQQECPDYLEWLWGRPLFPSWTRKRLDRYLFTDISHRCVCINSLQNGLLIKGDIYKNFDNYLILINLDVSYFCSNPPSTRLYIPLKDGWKIITFGFDPFGVDGRMLDPVCRKLDDSRHVSWELLRWYYRQRIFTNMRGEGEPIWKHDFPPAAIWWASWWRILILGRDWSWSLRWD